MIMDPEHVPHSSTSPPLRFTKMQGLAAVNGQKG